MFKNRSSLFSGSLILLITTNIFNFFNLIYNIILVRFLSVEDYGVAAALTQIILVFAIFGESIQLVSAKYSSNEPNKSNLKELMRVSFLKYIKQAILLFILYNLFVFFLSNLLKIDFLLLSLTGIMLINIALISLARGFLQGRKKFTQFGLTLVIESAVKVMLSLALILLGFKVYGAITGLILGTIAAIIFSIFSLKSIIYEKKSPSKKIIFKDITFPVLIINLIIILFISLDILIAKAIFDPYLAGAYAVASTLAKMIFFATSPISRAMLPFASESSNNPERLKTILIKSILTLLILIVLAILAFLIIPKFILNIYAGKIILESLQILPILVFSFSLFSVANLILIYKVAVGKIKQSYILLLAPIIEVLSLVYLSSSLLSFSIIILANAVIFLLLSFLIRK